MSYDRGPSIVLCELWERQSARSNTYYAGFWGGLSVALLRDGERPHPTRPDETVIVWKLVAQERERPAAPRKAPASPPERDAAAAPPVAALNAGARPDGRGRHFRREGKAARQERVSAAIASGLSVHGDEDLNDPVPF